MNYHRNHPSGVVVVWVWRVSYHLEGKNHLLLLHFIILTKNWSHTDIFSKSWFWTRESRKVGTPWWDNFHKKLNSEESSPLVSDMIFSSRAECAGCEYYQIIGQLPIALHCMHWACYWYQRLGPGRVLPNGRAITSNQLANGVNCHIHRVGLNWLNKLFWGKTVLICINFCLLTFETM